MRPCAQYFNDYKKLANWFLGKLLRLMKDENVPVASFRFQPAQFASLLNAIDRGTISANVGKDVLGEMFRSGKPPEEIIAEKGLAQVSDTSEIERVVDEVLAKNQT